MKPKKLMRKTLTQFIICVALLLLLATPLFYLLTKNYYAEDMIEMFEAVQAGKPVPMLDIEEDVLQGVVLQFVLIVLVLAVALVVMVRLISQRLWKPFDRTLQTLEKFQLEKGVIPSLPESDVEEFNRLNSVLDDLLTNSVKSYRIQKEFTENASHELQTPLAVFQSKLDLLMQQPDIKEEQAEIIQDLYRTVGRLARLNRNLLLLAKMENKQYDTPRTDIAAVLTDMQPYFENLLGDLTLSTELPDHAIIVNANRALLESLISNLVINAVRHNKPHGTIRIVLNTTSLSVENTSDEAALDESTIFSRFHHTQSHTEGNGLGLAIVKSVCDYHSWHIAYAYAHALHRFTITF